MKITQTKGNSILTPGGQQRQCLPLLAVEYVDPVVLSTGAILSQL